MTPFNSEESIVVKDRVSDWRKVLKKSFKEGLGELYRLYPFKRSLYIDYEKLQKSGKIGLELADEILKNPEKAITDCKDAIKQNNLIFLSDQQDEVDKINIRFINIPKRQGFEIRHINSQKIGSLVILEGVVKKAPSKPTKQITEAVFRCLNCGTLTPPYKQGYRKWVEPYRNCSQCERQTKFELVDKLSNDIDTQLIRIQDPPESLKGGQEPATIEVNVTDDLTSPENRVTPGNRVLIYGILRTHQIVQNGGKTPYFEYYIEANNVIKLSESFDDIEILEEDEAEILKLSKSKTLVKDIISSIAPEIYGHEEIKLAIALQLFGGIRKDNGQYSIPTRGDSHILIISDPGMAKSVLLRYVVELSPIGMFTSGKGTSSAGLTAAAVQDTLSKGWTIEAGAIVLADGGVLAVDEIDKMSPEDRGSIHSALEQQVVNINKAGMSMELPAKTAVLAAANPKSGRFIDSMSISSQLDFDPAILSRFDLIFVMQDKPDTEQDRRISLHILEKHRRGELKAKGLLTESSVIEPVIHPELFKKYIAFARQDIPILSDSAIRMIDDYFVKLRMSNGVNPEAVPATFRQEEGIVRLAEAYARMHLSDEITAEYAAGAISLVDHCLKAILWDKRTGKMDIDKLTSNLSSYDRVVISAIKDTLIEADGELSQEQLFSTLKSGGYDSVTVERMLDYLHGQMEIHKLTNGRVRITRK